MLSAVHDRLAEAAPPGESPLPSAADLSKLAAPESRAAASAPGCVVVLRYVEHHKSSAARRASDDIAIVDV